MDLRNVWNFVHVVRNIHDLCLLNLEQSATGQKQCCACRKAAGNFRERHRIYTQRCPTFYSHCLSRGQSYYRQIAVICKHPCFSSLHPYHLRMPVLQLLATLPDFRSQVSLQQSLVHPSLGGYRPRLNVAVK